MTEKEIAIDLLVLGMAGNLAQALTKHHMQRGTAPTVDELQFCRCFGAKTTREISDFCYERDLRPFIALTRGEVVRKDEADD